MNIVFSTDSRYLQHFTVSLTSLLENAEDTSKLNIVVIDGGIQESKKKYLRKLVENYNGILSFKNINRDKFFGANIDGHISEAAYYRILIPELFSKEVERVIYLDSDILVRDNIAKLWDFEMSESIIGAVKLNEYNGYDKLNLPKDSPYFNSGVLVINLKKWREEKITAKSLEYISNCPNKLIAHDQSVLNLLLHEKWQQLDYRWNLRTQIYDLDYKTAGFENKELFERVKRNPSIVHFTTASKPWHYLNDHPFKKEYFFYLDKSGYKYDKYPERAILLNKEIVIFGTGEKAENFTKRLNKFDFDVCFYSDNDERKWNNTFFMKEVKNPTVLKDINPDRIVIIASQYVIEIGKQLTEMGYVMNKNYFEDLDSLVNIIEGL